MQSFRLSGVLEHWERYEPIIKVESGQVFVLVEYMAFTAKVTNLDGAIQALKFGGWEDRSGGDA